MLCPPGDAQRAQACDLLAGPLWLRHKRSGDERLLEEAIGLQREALTTLPLSHPDRVRLCANFALILKSQSNLKHKARSQSLIDIIDIEREVLSLLPRGHPERATSCSNLAYSLSKLYQSSGHSDADADAEIVTLHRESLSLCARGHPLHAECCNALAQALSHTYRHQSSEHWNQTLQEVIDLFYEAITTSTCHQMWEYACSLSLVYSDKYSSTNNIDAAISWLYYSLENDPDSPWAAVARNLGCLSRIWARYEDLDSRHRCQLVMVYQRILNLLPLVMSPALELQSQLVRLEHFSQLGADAFVNATLSSESGFIIGIEMLEIFQGFFWSQQFHRRDPKLKKFNIPVDLGEELQSLLITLTKQTTTMASAHPHSSMLTSRDIVHADSVRLYAVLREIRSLPGCSRFMLGESFEQLRTVSLKHPVVVLVGSRQHFYALILSSGAAQGNILLPLALSLNDLEAFYGLNEITASLRGGAKTAELVQLPDSLDLGGKRSILRVNQSTPLSRYLKFLWEKIVNPIFEKLELQVRKGRMRPRLHWCPTGVFGALPLHAAGIHDAPPHVQETAIHVSRDRLSITVVAEKRPHDATLMTIPGVEDELKAVLSAFDSHSFKKVHQQLGSTTMEKVSAAMKTSHIAHLACHGVQDLNIATQSGFCLGDGRLSIADLMDLNIERGFLAFLSACETATGSKEQPDQSMHIAAAMIFAGFKNVVATKWEISDYDAPRLAQWFYDALLEDAVIDADSVAYALDFAVSKLRGAGVPVIQWAPFIHMGA